MKKTFLKPLKLQIKPVFEFSANDNSGMFNAPITDPITATTTVILTGLFNSSSSK